MITFLGALMISGTPDLFKPITGTIIGWACELMFHRTKRLCMPFIKERLANTARAKEDSSFCWEAPVSASSAPNFPLKYPIPHPPPLRAADGRLAYAWMGHVQRDGLQWIIEECYATQDPAQLDPVRVVRRLLYVNDISLHSTSFTVQNLIPDIYNFDQREALVEALREECSAVLKEAGGVWSRDAVQKLKLVDATIRESMRLTPFASIALPRTVSARRAASSRTSADPICPPQVVDPHGIFLDSPGGKFHVPRGTVIATPIDPIHHDAAVYPDPNRFNPFRFTQPGAARSIINAFDGGEGDRGDEQKTSGGPQAKSSATLDDRFLGFGFGKHACPGRFFALNEMKMFVAHMVLNYDVECLGKWPELTNMVWLKVPYNEGRVRVRKRQVAGTA